MFSNRLAKGLLNECVGELMSVNRKKKRKKKYVWDEWKEREVRGKRSRVTEGERKGRWKNVKKTRWTRRRRKEAQVH